MSVTILSLVVFVLSGLLKGAGVDVDDGQLTESVLTLLQVLTAVGVYWGRFRKGDLKWYGGRK